ncbi:hypothetical protein GCM10011611_09930 [Aliidongia dinghuensis]|uniref:Ferric uptake regulation protein n=2 Tax=Aliidongia dinghuensis TaxID=1867774 RepID=A0A8J2YQT6_9PROT|nr:hypothetical protein GCM10011611_09930 [Aliidongia dinghuensis]
MKASGLRFAKATAYNTLHAFTNAGLLKSIVVGPSQVFFDTDTKHHHHIYYEESGELLSVPARQDGLVDLPENLVEIGPKRLDIVVRVRR